LIRKVWAASIVDTSEMIKSNANLYHVKQFLGHKSFETLNHYARLDITDLRKTHERCHPREKDDC
jgi:site-specific recombinase XerD